MAYRNIPNISIEDARIIFKNFSGKGSDFNAEGVRNFCLVLDEENADKLRADGWNVKERPPRDEDDAPLFYLPVSVAFSHVPPKIVLVKGPGKLVRLDEDSVHILDTAYISKVDLTVTPYQWELKSGKSGVKAYLKTMYVTLDKDEFEDRYAGEVE